MQAVLTLAGEGTRMLPWSRGLRKEFLPLYDRGEDGSLVLKPVAHLVVESLIAAEADLVNVVVQPRDAGAVQAYFTVDHEFLKRHHHHADRLVETRRFYRTLDALRFVYTLQPRPAGFGDAVLRTYPVIGQKPFLLHAGDGIVVEPERGTALRTMAELRERENLDAVVLARTVADPRRYGVFEGRLGKKVGAYPRIDVSRMVEKPEHPKTHWAAAAVYAFGPRLFPALEAVRKDDRTHELELTAGIQQMIADGGRVAALLLSAKTGTWRSVGSPEGYGRALEATRKVAVRAAPARRND
ncbi:MAG: sugar phosphate nucleotidyltransferase [Thermoplasmata archaeon]|jgi:dTDP-glucose pyrophosphorylase